VRFKHDRPWHSILTLIVIGSGPAGRRAAVQAAKLKKSVLVVERGRRIGSA
jgi:pyruvate/2-oxoglutarate dehydrogenase complex dihydrolipoamide dehydrogenase (E3) component